MMAGDGALTFLFTDIEGSTQLWERYRSLMPEVLARHDALVQQQLDRCGGRLIKHTGDGIFAVFEGGDPLGCAVAIQRALRAEPWPEIGELRIRMALHAGPADQRDGDYFGPTINRAARILAAGWGGQILVTPEVKERCTLPEHAWLEDLGAHVLKDLIGHQTLYTLLTPDLNQKFPPLRSLSAHPNNLPQQTTPFIGRHNELMQLGELLVEGGCRLLTLVGPGGMGKTRLSIQTAAEYGEHFPHGVYFVSLAPLGSPDLLVSAIADALNLRFQQADDPAAQLLRALGEKEMLLVLDNFEHLLEGAPLLAEIVTRTPHIQILVTSRERLNLQAECLYELSGLQVPASAEAQVFEEFEAVDMFIAYARRHQPGYDLARDDRPAVFQICRLVGGMPLGIQLAAAWVRTLPPAEIAAELESDLDFLASSLRDVPERHRSMRAVFEYSWNLLGEAEQDVFKRLSVFRGGFTAAAAKQVAGASTRTLMALVDKSLLHHESNGRYQVHELLRQFAEEKLNESPEEAARVHDQHSTYFADLLAQGVETALNGGLQSTKVEDMVHEQDNLRAMWTWAVEHARADDVLKAALPYEFLLQIQTRYVEGAETYEAAARSLAARYPDGEADLALADVLSNLAWFYIRLGHVERARQAAEQSAALLGKARGVPINVFGFSPLEPLAVALSLKGGYEQAIALGETLSKLTERLPHAFSRGAGHYVQIGPYVALGRYDDARRQAEAALAHYRAASDDWFQAYLNIEYANVLRLLGEYDAAQRYADEGFRVKQDFADQEGMAVARNLQAQIALDRGDHAAARERFEQSLRVYREIGDNGGLATTLNGLGLASLLGGDTDDARRCLRQALEIATHSGFASLTLAILLNVARLWLHGESPACGAALLRCALEHPAGDHETHRRAETLLREHPAAQDPAPPPPELAAGRDLQQVAAWVLDQLGN